MISCGKMGANASGPTGSRVAGFSGGSSSKGRSGTRLYQLSGRAFSASRNLFDSTKTSGLLAVSHSALQLTVFRTAGLCEALGLAAWVHFLHTSRARPRPGPSGCPREASARAAHPMMPMNPPLPPYSSAGSEASDPQFLVAQDTDMVLALRGPSVRSGPPDCRGQAAVVRAQGEALE